MEYIMKGNKLAFKLNDEIICLDDFLDINVNYTYCIVKDKDDKILYEIKYNYNNDCDFVDPIVLKEQYCKLFMAYYCDKKIDLKKRGPQRIVLGISNIMLSNYLDKIIKLFKVYLKEECINDIKTLNSEQKVAKRVEKFKNDIKLLDEALEESKKMKETSKDFQNYKNRKIKETENLF